jgi:Peptidase family M20/M25/M40
MKLPLSSILLPLAVTAFELPNFGLGPDYDLSTKVQQGLNYVRNVARDTADLEKLQQHYDSIKSTIGNTEIPAFVKQFTDPIGSSPLLSLHRDLVQVQSITGDENSVGNFLVDYLTELNYTVETQRVSSAESFVFSATGKKKTTKDRFNVLAYLGKNRTTRALISSHIDTVPPYYEYKTSGKQIWGRGTVDAKGSVATQIRAVQELREKGKIEEGDIALLFVVGEESKPNLHLTEISILTAQSQRRWYENRQRPRSILGNRHLRRANRAQARIGPQRHNRLHDNRPRQSLTLGLPRVGHQRQLPNPPRPLRPR